MEIKGKVHCFFEQSGTFKNEFIKLGIPAEDYDIQNNFGETDHTDDLFQAIDDAYDGKPSLFDNISKDDLIIAFFPCIYFENIQMLYYSLENLNNCKKTKMEQIKDAINRLKKRIEFHILLYKLLYVCSQKEIRLIIENPYHKLGYLTGIQNFPPPKVIDMNRRKRGDYFVKPTAYWFWNCEPTKGFTYQPCAKENYKDVNSCRSAPEAGLCSEERSMISPDYARNFICDFILGKEQPDIDRQIKFDF
jgi:hypothetical protein